MPDEKDLKANLETINLREKEPVSPGTGQEQVARPEQEIEPGRAQEKAEAEPAPAIDAEGGGGEIATGAAPVVSDAERKRQIESVLAKDMEDFYMEMNETKKQEFKKAGEETSTKINELASKGKATAKKILELIKKWLALIPGVNKFFLEQEAKIKTDEIMKLNNNDG